MPSPYLNARLRSFGHAFRGLALLLRTQHNARIHALATALVLAAGAFVGLSRFEWVLIVLVIAGVWAAAGHSRPTPAAARASPPARG